ncbi:MAG TPA: gamma-glutamyltransferase [Polyangiaceae bacterium]|nr:gamma-glutamyltransferase [Polyangiaceae bacterium]
MRITASEHLGKPALQLLVLVSSLTLALTLGWPSTHAEAQPASAAAATENALCTREALLQIKAGGNAVDAAVAAAFVAGVTSPSSSGIGGGGFAMVWLASEQKPVLLDFREVAPQRVDAARLEERPLPNAERGRLIGVPGEVKGLFELHQRYGKRSWADVVGGAVHAAEKGFPVNPHLAKTLASARELAGLDPGLDAVFFAKGHAAAAGALARNPKLAATLRRIAAEGPPAFYAGEVAADLVASAASVQGALTLDELQAYRPIERTPVHVRWEGYDVYTMPPPSAGGLMLAQVLGLFSSAELKKLGLERGAYQHLIAEGMRGAIADRMRYVGDPAFTRIDFAALTSKERMAARRRRIALDLTHAVPRFALPEHGTHHLVTADALGNFVSLTTTVNRAFGAKISGNSGVVLNDQLDDFTELEDVKPLGITENPNRPRPGARPTSSMTPTIVTKNGSVVLALGGSGGPTISTNVTQLLLARLVFGKTPQQAVSAPRFYIPTRGNSYILLEKGAPKALVEDLESRGEIVGTMPFTGSAVQMIAVENGRKLAASDPRKHGKAEVR